VQADSLGGAADRDRIEPGALEEHVARLVPDLGVRPAHDPRERDAAGGVGDEQRVGPELPLLAVERLERLALGRPAHHDPFLGEQAQVEGVERVSQLEEHVVRDVDDDVDRPDAAGLEAGRHPGRSGPDAHVADDPRRVARTEIGRLDLDRRGAVHRLDVLLGADLREPQLAIEGHRQLPSDADVVHGVAPVGPDVYVEHGVVAVSDEIVDGEADRGQPLGDLGRALREVHVLAQPAQLELHRYCLRKRMSFSKNRWMLGTPYFSIAMRSMPPPNAKPCQRSGS
jgi:hypothetical protein